LLAEFSNNSSATEIGAVAAANLTASQFPRTRINDAVIKHWVEMDKLPIDAQTINRDSEVSATGSMIKPPEDLGVIQYPQSTRSIAREEVLQEWEGQVQEVGERYFSARLVDLTQNGTEETEESELPLDDLVEGDRALLIPGAVFRWIIGYRWEDGEKGRFTRVVIRRLPIWTEQEIKSADKEAAELHHALFGNRSRRAAAAGSD
jgi:hypothetical protein